MGKEEVEKPEKELFVGFDVGSSFVHYVVLGADRGITYSAKPIMHFANPIGAVKEAWRDITKRLGANRIRSTAFTGSGAESFPKVMRGVTYVFDSVAIPKGVEAANPQARYIVHMGAKDSYFFHLERINARKVIQEWRTGTKCGGGSGTLIEKQCRRLFEGEIPNPKLEDTALAQSREEKESIRIKNRAKLQARLEEMFHRAEKEAERSTEASEFLARCGVVIQSDLIHKQNEGTKREDNLAGLFRTVARNYKIDVLGARQFEGPEDTNGAIATGGVLANDLIRKNLEEFLGLPIERPGHYNNVAAIGAAVKAIEQDNNFVFSFEQLDKVATHSREKRKSAPSLAECLEKVHEKSQDLTEQIEQGTEVVLGIDGGSTTTKGALVELRTGKLLDKLYIKTHGNPEESLKRVLEYLGRHRDKVIVKGVGATGSARKLYEKILVGKKNSEELTKKAVEVTDRITDEITCHALGVKHCNSDVDTIFEVGGQDMKFTSFAADGTVKEAKMNYSCQAGSGQTLENMADVINLNVESTLQEAALRAKRVPIIDSTCGVFMEMDENRLIAEGFGKEEIAAAIVRGTAASYYYKFVGGSGHGGKKCSAQGGPPLGKAFLAALAQVTNKEIEAYPHREMFGAWGQALDIIEHIKQLEAQGKSYGSAFRGWGLVDMPFEKRSVSCKELFKEKSCGMRDCQLEVFCIEDDEIITGGFCPRGNSETAKKPKTNYVERYHKIYEKHFKKQGCLLEELSSARTEDRAGATVGIKRSTATLGEKGIWSAALFRVLGLCPVVSPRTDKEIAKSGVDNSRTEFCIARKLATGHAAVLNSHRDIEYLFNPSFIEQRTDNPPDLKYCIYTESEGYVLNDVLSLDKSRQINPILHFGDEQLLLRELKREFDRLGFGFTDKQIRGAVRSAEEAENKFKEELYAEGDKFLERIEASNEKAYVGLGRDYVLLDPEASSNSGSMFSQIRGLNYIPQLFLEHKFANVRLEDIVENEFWVQSVKILKANLFVAEHPNLFGIRMMNFACGPDSLKIYQEEKMQRAADKPILVLLTDAQTNNAPFVTRTEAHERVVNQSKQEKLRIERLKRRTHDGSQERTWLIPYMGDASIIGAAGLRYFGVDSKALPTNTQRGYEIARRHIYTEVCHPLKGVVGDAIAFLQEEIERKGADYVDENYLVMLPTTSGPCRFGKYTELVREFLDREGLEKVPVAGPSSETDYLDIPFPKKLSVSDKTRMQRMLYKGIKSSDLLEDIFLRFHPYADDKESMEELKKERLGELEKVVEAGTETPALIEWGEKTVSLFKACKLRSRDRFPLVLYIGEIYVRQHDPCTDFVIRKLEESGLEVVRDPVTDWLDYVNKMNQRNSRRDVALRLKSLDLGRTLKTARKYANSLLKGKYMSSVEHKITEPFHEVLDGRHVLPKPMQIIETLERQHEFHANIEGESPLSTGIAYQFMHDLTRPRGDAYISGIFHVGPFTCMQEGVATAKIEAMAKELRKRKPDLVFPIIHAFFGDSASVNLDSEIAVFTEQCYQKREMLKEKYGHKAPPAAVPGGMDIRSVPQSKRSAESRRQVKS
ncbi:MAG: acyl-CoA dehydratase activase-related protein [Planctomycetota bacterium]|jgi:activator of 2-hydroxyglutaryl-CoA dehydratase/predicted nucleotide-binding protein (sugar kinase/HSP70/actin superfamily)